MSISINSVEKTHPRGTGKHDVVEIAGTYMFSFEAQYGYPKESSLSSFLHVLKSVYNVVSYLLHL